MSRLRPVLLVFILSSVISQSPAQRTITIDPTAPRQTFEGWGTSLAWFANGVGGWPDPQRDRLAAALFDPKTGLGLTYIRFNIGGGDNPHNPKPIRLPQNDMPGYEPTPGHFDWSADANQRWIMQKAQSYGANLIEAMSYSPPYWMTISGTSEGAADGGSNMQQKYFGHQSGGFADYLTTVVAHYHDAWGITFRTLDPLNEPLPRWWRSDDRKQEGAHFSIEEQDKLLRDTGLSLASKHLLTTVSAPDENNIDNTVKELRAYSSAAKTKISQVNTHSYGGTQRSALQDLAAADGKRLTMSEWGSSDPTGKQLSQQIQRDITGMDAVSWSIWQPDWPSLFKIDYQKQQFSLTPLYAIYGNYTRFIRPGYQFLPTDDPTTLSAYDFNTKTLVIVEQNWTASPATLTFNLSGFTLKDSTVTTHRASGATLAIISTTPSAAHSFTAEAPPQSVTTYVISGASINAPTTPIPIRGKRTLNRIDDSITVPFTGSQARLYGDFGPSQGIAAFSIDGGAETDVDLYAPKQADNLVIFSTPLLKEKNHTLKVRVTGLKNPASFGYAVTTTHADIASPHL